MVAQHGSGSPPLPSGSDHTDEKCWPYLSPCLLGFCEWVKNVSSNFSQQNVGDCSRAKAQWHPWILSHLPSHIHLAIKSLSLHLINCPGLCLLVAIFLATNPDEVLIVVPPLQHYLPLLNSLSPLPCPGALVARINVTNPISELVNLLLNWL